MVCVGVAVKRTMYQRKIDVGILNAVKSVLADVSSVNPSSEQRVMNDVIGCLSLQDFDNDGWPELLVTADYGDSRMFWNQQNNKFQECTANCGLRGEQVVCEYLTERKRFRWGITDMARFIIKHLESDVFLFIRTLWAMLLVTGTTMGC